MGRAIFILATIIILFASQLTALANQHEVDLPYSLDQALNNGFIEMSSGDPPPPQSMADVMAELKSIEPGVVNDFGYFWGGPRKNQLEQVKKVAGLLHESLPKALLGTGLPEGVAPEYTVELPDASGRLRTFSGRDMVTGKPITATGQVEWFDITKEVTQQYCIALGRIFIDDGISMIRFEEGAAVIQNSPNRNQAFNGFRYIKKVLTAYGESKGVKVYFGSGDGHDSGWFAKALDLDYAFTPARFYINASGKFGRDCKLFQNKVLRPGIGKGYSYTLSKNIMDFQKSNYPPTTKIIFKLDHYDGAQDDLRRLMELDALNRRFMLTSSIRAARKNGCYFAPDLYCHCGCTPIDAIGDPNEIITTRKGERTTQYDALLCGDDQVIAQAFHR